MKRAASPTESRQQIFAVKFEAKSGAAGVRALRALLKIALRRFELHALDAREETAADRVARHFDERSPRRQQLVAQLYASGPRPVLEALLEVASGRELDDVLERFARVPPSVYRALGADELTIEAATVVDGSVR